MVRSAAGGRRGGKRSGPIIGVLVAATMLVAPHVAGATGDVTVTVNAPQFDPKDGNYAAFSGTVTNASTPDSTSGCFQLGEVGCLTQFALFPAGVPGSFQLGPQLIWGLQGTPSITPVATTINMSTAPGVIPGTTYQAALFAIDSAGTLWQSARSQPFQWPPDDLSLARVSLGESRSGASTVTYTLDHGGTPFRGRARLKGQVFDGKTKLGQFVDRVKAGTHTRVLPKSIDRRLVEGQRYRVRLDARDTLSREAHFRDKLRR
jgi:hypothetical protein